MPARLRIVLTAVIIAAAPHVGRAQVPGQPPPCPRCFIASYVDIPSAAAASPASGGFFIAGWGFLCESGQPVDRVDVWYEVGPNKFEPAGGAGSHGNGFLAFGIYRPDVLLHYAPYCPSSNGMVGWHFYFTSPVPPGTRQVKINVWRGPFLETHTRTVVFK